jgi:nucleoside-diphosphate-sugar epimerase
MSETFPRVAIVTGATSGFGRATAEKFISAGFGVVGCGRNQSPSGVRVSLVEPGACLTGFQSSAGYSDDIIRTMTDQYGLLICFLS